MRRCDVCDATAQRGREPDDKLGDYANTSGVGRGGERTGEAASWGETATETTGRFDVGGVLATVIFVKIVVKGLRRPNHPRHRCRIQIRLYTVFGLECEPNGATSACRHRQRSAKRPGRPDLWMMMSTKDDRGQE